MSAYCFFDVREIKDEEKMEQYRSRVFDTVKQYRGHYLAIGGDTQSVEGQWKPTLPVIIEFPSVAQARQWYNSEEYAELKKMRLEATVGDMVIIEGFE